MEFPLDHALRRHPDHLDQIRPKDLGDADSVRVAGRQHALQSLRRHDRLLGSRPAWARMWASLAGWDRPVSSPLSSAARC